MLKRGICMEIDLIYYSCRNRDASFREEIRIRAWDILLLVSEGCLEVTLGEPPKTVVMEERSILLVPANTPFARHARTPVKIYSLSFQPDSEHPFRRGLPPGILHLPPTQTASILADLDRAEIIPDNRVLLLHIIEHILAEYYLFGTSEKPNFRHVSEELLKIIRYMNLHLSERIDMKRLAEQFYLSHTGLIYKFRHELGTTPSQYLILLRIRYAKQLLLNETCSIGEVAERCGYNNPFYFSNAFRRHTGMNPSEFRRHYLKSNPTN